MWRKNKKRKVLIDKKERNIKTFLFLCLVNFNMLKMMKKDDRKMLMIQLHQSHLISKLSFNFIDSEKNKKILFRKMFIGGLSWQTAPGNYNQILYSFSSTLILVVSLCKVQLPRFTYSTRMY
jgi:hypothetical protein